MKSINEFITESNVNKVMFDVCMELENNQELYKLLTPLVKQCQSKIDEFDFEKLENSSSIDKIITSALKVTGGKLDSESRKTLSKYVVSIIIKLMDCFGTNLPKELEDYMIEWDFYKKLEW